MLEKGAADVGVFHNSIPTMKSAKNTNVYCSSGISTRGGFWAQRTVQLKELYEIS